MSVFVKKYLQKPGKEDYKSGLHFATEKKPLHARN